MQAIVSTYISSRKNNYSKQPQIPAETCPIPTITTVCANYLKRNQARRLAIDLLLNPFRWLIQTHSVPVMVHVI